MECLPSCTTLERFSSMWFCDVWNQDLVFKVIKYIPLHFVKCFFDQNLFRFSFLKFLVWCSHFIQNSLLHQNTWSFIPSGSTPVTLWNSPLCHNAELGIIYYCQEARMNITDSPSEQLQQRCFGLRCSWAFFFLTISNVHMKIPGQAELLSL